MLEKVQLKAPPRLPKSFGQIRETFFLAHVLQWTDSIPVCAGLNLHAHCADLKESAKEREKLMKAATKDREAALKVVQERDDALRRKEAEKEEAVQSQRLVEDGEH